jgi:hypothetical protein
MPIVSAYEDVKHTLFIRKPSGDEFQIIVAGNGRFGRDDVSPYFVRFSRAHTAYGPLNAGLEEGSTFMTLKLKLPGLPRPKKRFRSSRILAVSRL